jgi:hypothetical protein
MISTQLARALRDSGLAWRPASGDAFRIDRIEADEELFTLSDMTVEAHTFDTGTVLGFNGTTEWALDSVALEDALWHPHESQLRELLAAAFVSLERTGSGGEVEYVVRADVADERRSFEAADAADAYARALLAVLDELAA